MTEATDIGDILKRHGKFRGKEVLEKSRKHMEPNEIDRFFVKIKEKSPLYWYPFYYLTYQFGCRVTETSIILKEDVSFETKQIIIRRVKKRNEEGGFAEKLYDIDDKLLGIISIALAYSEHYNKLDNPYLFPAQRKRKSRSAFPPRDLRLRRLEGFHAVSRRTAYQVFVDTCSEIEIPKKLAHPHTLRHTRATLMLADGIPAEQVQYFLGHENIKTTHGYLGMAMSMRSRYQESVDFGMGGI